jgi:hypothetical protein
MGKQDDWGMMSGGEDVDEEFLGPRRSNTVFFAIHAALCGALWWWASHWAPNGYEERVRWIVLVLSTAGFALALGFWLATQSRRSYYLKNEKANLSDDDRRVGALRMGWRASGLARYMGACAIWAAPWLATLQGDQVQGAVHWALSLVAF